MSSTNETATNGTAVPFPRTAPAAEPSNVVPFTRPDRAETDTAEPAPAGPVERDEALQGELLTDEENAALDRRLSVSRALTLRPSPQRTAALRAGTWKAATKTTRVSVRAAYTVAQGHASWARRAGDALTHGHVREQVRRARLAGDAEALAEWTDRLTELKNSRAERLRELPATLYAGLKAAFVVTVVLAGLLIVAGVGFQLYPGGWDWADWWGVVGDVFGVVGLVFTLAVHLVLWGSLPALLVAAWREGRRAATAPRWLVSAQERAEMDSEITSDLITRALAHVKVPALAKYLKDGGALEYVVAPREQGGGTYTQVRLPMGVTAAELLGSAKVELLAGNLGRHRHEVWPQREKDSDARVLDLWVADKGTMDKPAPPWPLLTDGEFDVFRDRLPWGVTMRQDPVCAGMLQKHWLVGATSKQGKSTALRLLALGLALDPTVELKIADLKGDGDWSMFRERATTLIEGSTDEDAEATAEMLEWAVGEVARRYEAKQKAGIVGPIPREVSRRKDSGFHPVYVFVDECQVLYGAPHPIGGSKDDARAWRAAKKLHDQARAVNVHLLQATQRPDDRTLPVRVREGAHVRCSLNVPNYETARMVLADAADRGARPQDLRPGADAGTVVGTGELEDIPKGQAFIIIRTHYVSTKDAYAVLQRAMTILKRYGRSVERDEADADETKPIDHLAAIRDALRDEPRVRTQVVLARLAETDPERYEDWTFPDLAAELDRHGIEIKKSNGVKVVRADLIDNVITERDKRDVDDGAADTP
jgi:S-DNA-T family DNA segregation ATPase FtsK/SpoIIIE